MVWGGKKDIWLVMAKTHGVAESSVVGVASA